MHLISVRVRLPIANLWQLDCIVAHSLRVAEVTGCAISETAQMQWHRVVHQDNRPAEKTLADSLFHINMREKSRSARGGFNEDEPVTKLLAHLSYTGNTTEQTAWRKMQCHIQSLDYPQLCCPAELACIIESITHKTVPSITNIRFEILVSSEPYVIIIIRVLIYR